MAALKPALDRNEVLTDVMEWAAAMDLSGWRVASGCLFQTVWNVITGRPPGAGIQNYDLVYYDARDLSWEAEGEVIKREARVSRLQRSRNPRPVAQPARGTGRLPRTSTAVSCASPKTWPSSAPTLTISPGPALSSPPWTSRPSSPPHRAGP